MWPIDRTVLPADLSHPLGKPVCNSKNLRRPARRRAGGSRGNEARSRASENSWSSDTTRTRPPVFVDGLGNFRRRLDRQCARGVGRGRRHTKRICGCCHVRSPSLSWIAFSCYHHCWRHYFCLMRFNASPQATTWSSIASTSASCRGSGLNFEKFWKSVKSDSMTCARTSATISSPITSRSCSTARAPPALP